MWVILIIACLVCILDKTGYLLDEKLEKLLYVEDNSQPSKAQSTSEQPTQEQPTQSTQYEPSMEYESNVQDELDLNKSDLTEPKRGNPIKPEDALYEIKKSSR